MKINYRPEIDGLRAISVIAIIIYHSKIYFLGRPLLPGGNFGVDIFFVISGYLITSTILKEIKTSGSFSIINFYERRIRRILPALFFVVIISLPIAWIFLLPNSFIDFSNSILFSLSFISNFYFYFSGQVYGLENGLLKPFLHTWSLSVEEQFYVLFPFLFLFFKKNKKIIFLFILISLTLSFYISVKNPDLNFYILPCRAWEILLGSFFAYNKIFLDAKIYNKNYNEFFSFFGFFLIIISFVYGDFTIINFSISRIFSVLGALLIIKYCNDKIIFSKILSNKLAANIGLISYSLYLWHYPIFAFVRIGNLSHNFIDNFLIGLLIFLISIFSYFCIEKPFRDKKLMSFKKILVILLLFLITIFSSLFLIIFNKGFPGRFPTQENFSLDNAAYAEEIRIKKYELGVPDFKKNGKNKILIIGNSHGRDLFNSLKLNEELFSEYEFSILDTQIYCLVNILKNDSYCERKLDNKLKRIFEASDTIILSSSFNDKDISSLEDVIVELKKTNKKIILTTIIPTFNFVDSKLLIDEFFIKNKRLPFLSEKNDLEKKYYNFLDKKINTKNEAIISLSKKYNIKTLNKFELFCNKQDKTCIFLTDDNYKIFYNKDHYSIDGAKFIGRKIKETGWLEIK